MCPTLDHGQQPSKRFTVLTWAVLIAVVEHILIFGFYAATLDGGVLARMCMVISLGYWLIVTMIVVRRHRHATKLDLLFIVVGYPLILFPCIRFVRGTL